LPRNLTKINYNLEKGVHKEIYDEDEDEDDYIIEYIVEYGAKEEEGDPVTVNLTKINHNLEKGVREELYEEIVEYGPEDDTLPILKRYAENNIERQEPLYPFRSSNSFCIWYINRFI
jgi:hypothetical protein